MNCKPGDLAVCVRADPDLRHLIGKICTVTKLDPDFRMAWQTDPVIRYRGYLILFNDADIRPIRPSEGEDEMLRIAGRPVQEVA